MTENMVKSSGLDIIGENEDITLKPQLIEKNIYGTTT